MNTYNLELLFLLEQGIQKARENENDDNLLINDFGQQCQEICKDLDSLILQEIIEKPL